MPVEQSADATPAPLTAFVSYARADQPQATLLVAALEQAGLRVWWDALIEGGAAFAKSIEAALAACDVVVVLWSANSVESDWVRDEAAKGRDRRRLVPVALDGRPPPLGFGQYHAIDFSQWKGDAAAPEVQRLLRGIAAAAGATSLGNAAGSAAATDAPVAPYAPPVSRRKLLLAAGGVALAGAAGLFVWRRTDHVGRELGASNSAGNTIAVLPFQNLSGDLGQAWFSDGLSEEVRATLSRDPRLLVMAPTSSGKFRDRSVGAVEIANKLGVAYLLEGSVRRANDVVRVAAELIDGQSGFARWSQSFERRMTDIFAVQSEIADTVARELARRVAPADVAAGKPAVPLGSVAASNPAAPVAAGGGTSSVVAFDAYLRGRALYDLSVDEASDRAALAQFDAAIAADPNYAAAHAARARTLTAIANQYGAVGELALMYDAAIAAARRAIEISPGLADAHSTLGYVLFQGRLDARAAREPFDRSRQLGAGDAAVMARFAQYCARVGREADAAAAIQRALALDPLNPLIYRAAATIEYAARRYEASLLPLRKALAMNPKMSRAHAAVGDALLMLGRLPEAREAYAAESVEDVGLAGKAIIEQRLGNRPAAQQAFAKLVSDLGERVLYQQAQVYAQWGDRDAAIARLQRAREVGDSGLIYARNDPLLDPLRGDDRYRRLLSGMGFD